MSESFHCSSRLRRSHIFIPISQRTQWHESIASSRHSALISNSIERRGARSASTYPWHRRVPRSNSNFKALQGLLDSSSAYPPQIDFTYPSILKNICSSTVKKAVPKLYYRSDRHPPIKGGSIFWSKLCGNSGGEVLTCPQIQSSMAEYPRRQMKRDSEAKFAPVAFRSRVQSTIPS